MIIAQKTILGRMPCSLLTAVVHAVLAYSFFRGVKRFFNDSFALFKPALHYPFNWNQLVVWHN